MYTKQMAFGTDLESAYGPLNPDNSSYNMQEPLQVSTEAKQKYATPSDYREKVYDKENDAAAEKQYETEQKLLALLQNLKKNKPQKDKEESPSYIDKLGSKKKEILKLIQLALIIVLGLSLHNIIEFYLKDYITSTDFSYERQILIRLLYPLAIVFVLWNLKVYLK